MKQYNKIHRSERLRKYLERKRKGKGRRNCIVEPEEQQLQAGVSVDNNFVFDKLIEQIKQEQEKETKMEEERKLQQMVDKFLNQQRLKLKRVNNKLLPISMDPLTLEIRRKQTQREIHKMLSRKISIREYHRKQSKLEEENTNRIAKKSTLIDPESLKTKKNSAYNRKDSVNPKLSRKESIRNTLRRLNSKDSSQLQKPYDLDVILQDLDDIYENSKNSKIEAKLKDKLGLYNKLKREKQKSEPQTRMYSSHFNPLVRACTSRTRTR